MSNKNAQEVKTHLLELFEDAFEHDGFSEIKIEIKILKRLQKEIILHYGKQYRYVLDTNTAKKNENHHQGELNNANGHSKNLMLEQNN